MLLLGPWVATLAGAYYSSPQYTDVQQGSQNLESSFRNVLGELNSMHGFMKAQEQTEYRDAQEKKVLQAQNAQMHNEETRFQQQIAKLQQQLAAAKEQNSRLQAKDSQLTTNYQKLSTASKKLAQQYKALDAQAGELRKKDASLEHEKTGLVSALRKFKGIIAAQSRELDTAISGAADVREAQAPTGDAPGASSADPMPAELRTLTETAATAQSAEPVPVEGPALSLPATTPNMDAQPAEVVAAQPQPAEVATPPALPPSAPMHDTAPTVSADDDATPPVDSPKPSDTHAEEPKFYKPFDSGKQKDVKTPSALDKSLSSLSQDKKKMDQQVEEDAPVPGMDQDMSKIAAADDQVLQMARDAGFLPSA